VHSIFALRALAAQKILQVRDFGAALVIQVSNST
jgi:hypothetical protein